MHSTIIIAIAAALPALSFATPMGDTGFGAVQARDPPPTPTAYTCNPLTAPGIPNPQAPTVDVSKCQAAIAGGAIFTVSDTTTLTSCQKASLANAGCICAISSTLGAIVAPAAGLPAALVAQAQAALTTYKNQCKTSEVGVFNFGGVSIGGQTYSLPITYTIQPQNF